MRIILKVVTIGRYLEWVDLPFGLAPDRRTPRESREEAIKRNIAFYVPTFVFHSVFHSFEQQLLHEFHS